MICAIIQARMGSTRLPGKILKKVNGMTLLEYQVHRIKKAQLLNRIIIATTNLNRDNKIEKLCAKRKIECFRGSQNNVLDRYYQCAKMVKADIIVRLTADCPLVDPEIIDKTIKLFLQKKPDYCSNTIPPESSRYPDGSDVEVFSMKALRKAWKEVKNVSDEEHVTFYLWKNNRKFTTIQLKNTSDWSPYRFTIDYPEDFAVVKFIIEELISRNSFGHLPEIIDILRDNPQIKNLNREHYSGEGWNK